MTKKIRKRIVLLIYLYNNAILQRKRLKTTQIKLISKPEKEPKDVFTHRLIPVMRILKYLQTLHKTFEIIPRKGSYPLQSYQQRANITNTTVKYFELHLDNTLS